MWSLEFSLLAVSLAAGVIAVAGYHLVSVADEIADRTRAGEALIGATLLGGTTSLADITAVLSAAHGGYASMAVSAAVGGIAVQLAFLALADLALRRVNLEHAAASLPNLVSTSVLIMILSLVLTAPQLPDWTVWRVHPITFLLFAAYFFGMRLVLLGQQEPMWNPRQTTDTRVDEPAAKPDHRSWRRLIIIFLIAGSSLAVAGWVLSEAGRALMEHLGLLESAVGGIIIAVSTSLPELVTSVAAVRAGALTLAVGGVIGGNSFDILMVGMADIAYSPGSIYHHIQVQDLALTALTMFMSVVLLLGLLLRQRRGPINIGLESTLILLAYAISVVLLNVRY